VYHVPIPVGLPALLAVAYLVSLITVAVPGPPTLVAARLGLRRRMAAAWFLAGVTSLDLALFLSLAGGAGPLLFNVGAMPAVELVGGLALLVGGALALGRRAHDPSAGLHLPSPTNPRAARGNDPTSGLACFVLGVAVAGGNPQYWVWWVTAGLAFVEAARGYGHHGLTWMLLALVGGVVTWWVVLLTGLHHGALALPPRLERLLAAALGWIMVLLGAGLASVGAWRLLPAIAARF